MSEMCRRDVEQASPSVPPSGDPALPRRIWHIAQRSVCLFCLALFASCAARVGGYRLEGTGPNGSPGVWYARSFRQYFDPNKFRVGFTIIYDDPTDSTDVDDSGWITNRFMEASAIAPIFLVPEGQSTSVLITNYRVQVITNEGTYLEQSKLIGKK